VVKFTPSLLMGSVANQAQLLVSLSNSDNNDDHNQRPIQILQPAVELRWFEGTRKVGVLTFVLCMDRIALVTQWLDDTMGAHSG